MNVLENRPALEAFLDEVYAHDNLDVILAGAGTSAFIGDILEGPFQKNTGKHTRAVATTDIVSYPTHYLHTETPTLLVSFARSGNSPESIAAIEIADKVCFKIYHLILTCNSAGKLATRGNNENTFTFLLPPASNDQSLAMTGSFTCMLLAGLLISRLSSLDYLKFQVEQLAGYGENIINTYSEKLKEVARLDFKRAVFLGSGPLKGTARESHLKLQELTDGKVVCKYDSFLGFRHGPKAVVDKSTLLVYLFSSVEYVHQYELDLVNLATNGESGLYRIGVIESDTNEFDSDLTIELSDGETKIDDEFLSVCSVLPAQILGFFKAINLGLEPDSPSVSGAITRVVQGVNIYPYHLPLEKQV
jgi:tagatose-6-phosphate ketose/aldose isomerase